MRVEPRPVEVGLGLVRGGQNSPLLRRMAAIRRQMATDLGYMVPPVRVTDKLQLKASEYGGLSKRRQIARFELLLNHDLAILPSSAKLPAAGAMEGIHLQAHIQTLRAQIAEIETAFRTGSLENHAGNPRLRRVHILVPPSTSTSAFRLHACFAAAAM